MKIIQRKINKKKHKWYLLLFLPNVLYLFFSSSGANKIAYDSGDRNLCKIFIDLKLPTQKFECYDPNISLYYYLFLSVLKSGVCVCTPSMENGHLVYTCSWSWSTKLNISSIYKYIGAVTDIIIIVLTGHWSTTKRRF